MPIVDMPIAELRKYKGSTPRPADFDAYWDRALAELDRASLELELVPADFHVDGIECYDLYYTGVGGARIHGKFLKPAKIEKPAPAVCLFHGYSGNCGGWMEKVAYAANGMVVAAIDARGQGGYSEDNGRYVGNTLHGHIIRGLADENPDNLYFRNVFLDCAQIARILMALPYVDETRVGCHGGSQGGALTVACMCLEPRINRAVPVFPFLSDYKRVWDMDLDVAAYAELKEYLRLSDPRHERIDEMWEKLGYIDLQNLACRCRANVLMMTGLMDTICPPSTQFAIFNKLECPHEVIFYPDYGHEGLPDAPEIAYKFLSEMAGKPPRA